MITDKPWMASAPHPQTGACVITNQQGRIVAAMVPSQEDAEFICAARNTNTPSASPIGIKIGSKLEALHEHIGSAWTALRNQGRSVGDCDERPDFPVGSVEYHLNAIEEYAGDLFQLLAKISPAVGDT